MSDLIEPGDLVAVLPAFRKGYATHIESGHSMRVDRLVNAKHDAQCLWTHDGNTHGAQIPIAHLYLVEPSSQTAVGGKVRQVFLTFKRGDMVVVRESHRYGASYVGCGGEIRVSKLPSAGKNEVICEWLEDGEPREQCFHPECLELAAGESPVCSDPKPASIKLGDVVILNSGGPSMTVAMMNANNVNCTWFATGDVLSHGVFKPEMLRIALEETDLWRVWWRSPSGWKRTDQMSPLMAIHTFDALRKESTLQHVLLKDGEEPNYDKDLQPGGDTGSRQEAIDSVNATIDRVRSMKLPAEAAHDPRITNYWKQLGFRAFALFTAASDCNPKLTIDMIRRKWDVLHAQSRDGWHAVQDGLEPNPDTPIDYRMLDPDEGVSVPVHQYTETDKSRKASGQTGEIASEDQGWRAFLAFREGVEPELSTDMAHNDWLSLAPSAREPWINIEKKLLP